MPGPKRKFRTAEPSEPESSATKSKTKPTEPQSRTEEHGRSEAPPTQLDPSSQTEEGKEGKEKPKRSRSRSELRHQAPQDTK